MPFWDTQKLAEKFGDKTALINSDAINLSNEVSYRELHKLVKKAAEHIGLELPKQLIVIEATNNIETIVYYLAVLQLNHALWLVDKNLDGQSKQSLYRHYQVNKLIINDKVATLNNTSLNLSPELTLLLSTSGTTGSRKLVRLSATNLSSNCQSIIQYLPIVTSDVTITSLPIHYSFGLSIINSHLEMGAAIVVCNHGVLSAEFWELFKGHQVTSFYGVPYHFEMLLKLKLSRLSLETIRYFAVAGGKLLPAHVISVENYCQSNSKQLFLMYGQTEATARISYLKATKTQSKPNSIGQEIPAGKMWIEDQDGNAISESNVEGELCYQGENVMLGLAESVSDLELGFTTDILKTGDLALRDGDGDYSIVGRLKRFIKVLGHRINLDEIEEFLLGQDINAVCLGKDDLLRCFVKSPVMDKNAKDRINTLITRFLNIHSKYCRIDAIESFPRLTTGKIDYCQLGNL